MNENSEGIHFINEFTKPIPTPRKSILKLSQDKNILTTVSQDSLALKNNDLASSVDSNGSSENSQIGSNESNLIENDAEEQAETDEVSQLISRRDYQQRTGTHRTMSYKAASKNPYMVPHIIGRDSRKLKPSKEMAIIEDAVSSSEQEISNSVNEELKVDDISSSSDNLNMNPVNLENIAQTETVQETNVIIDTSDQPLINPCHGKTVSESEVSNFAKAPIIPPPRVRRKSKTLSKEKQSLEELIVTEIPIFDKVATPYAVAIAAPTITISKQLPSNNNSLNISPHAIPYCVTNILSNNLADDTQHALPTNVDDENFYSPVEVTNSPKIKTTMSSENVASLSNSSNVDFRKFASVEALDRHKRWDKRAKSTGSRPLSLLDSDSTPDMSTLSVTNSNTSGMTTSSTSVNSNSDDSDQEDEDKLNQQISEEKKKHKTSLVAKEILTSEKTFCDVLRLLNVDFREALDQEKRNSGRSIIDQKTLDQLFPYMAQMQRISEEFVKDLKKRINHWSAMPMLADIFVKKGPFLKLYSSYISEYDSICQLLDELRRKSSDFNNVVTRFEATPRCAGLALKHYMLKPVQRIPQYRLLLSEYKKNLPSDSPDSTIIDEALKVVCKVAEHANQTMKQEDNLQKLLTLQNSLVGQFEAIKPFRQFIKDGILNKVSRKEVQMRRFILLSDVLLYATPSGSSTYRLKNELSLTGMKVSVPSKEEVANEFHIISVQRSFTLSARTVEERTEWVNVLKTAINNYVKKRSTFTKSVCEKMGTLEGAALGDLAPLWVPDDRVSMCAICANEFSFTFRRHHCRACGKVVCAYCSEYKWPLRYLKSELGRVCCECYETLQATNGPLLIEQPKSPIGSFVRGVLRSSLGPGEKKRPAVLKQSSNDDNQPIMNGHCKMWTSKRWKKRWLSLRGNVLFVYKASGDTAASESYVLLGYNIVTVATQFQGVDPSLIIELIHKNLPAIVMCMESGAQKDMWRELLEKAATVV